MPTQDERRRATRQRLLDAAAEVLEARGSSGFTTTEVGRRAGLSQGAIFKHFATKADLLAATVEHVFSGLVTRYEGEFAARAAVAGSAPDAGGGDALTARLHTGLELHLISTTLMTDVPDWATLNDYFAEGFAEEGFAGFQP